MGVYYFAFGLMIFLAEIRHTSMKNTILAPFGFLQTWMGRGVFYIILGTIFVSLPIDVTKPYVAYIPASFLISMGVFQIFLSIFVVKASGRAGRRL